MHVTSQCESASSRTAPGVEATGRREIASYDTYKTFVGNCVMSFTQRDVQYGVGFYWTLGVPSADPLARFFKMCPRYWSVVTSREQIRWRKCCYFWSVVGTITLGEILLLIEKPLITIILAWLTITTLVRSDTIRRNSLRQVNGLR